MLWHKLSELPVVTIAKRYPDGGGLTAAERAGWEQVRLAELTGLDRKETR